MKRTDKEYLNNLYNMSPEGINDMSPDDIKELINDLQDQKFELEMQNDELRRAHLEIEESRNRYYDLFDFAPVSYFTLNREGIITELNLSASRMLGVERRNLLNKSIFNFLADDCKLYFEAYLNKIFNTNTKQVSEIKLVSKKGTLIYAQTESITVSNGFDSVMNCRTAVIDVTKRKQTEEALQESQNFIQSISAATPSIIYLYDIEEQKIVYINRAFGTILG
ncbi:MAG: PAS domain-containing protein, partial [Bacteroidota bacterium]|nr:PAS domain-containing protein [Bacteroidota bacterium]